MPLIFPVILAALARLAPVAARLAPRAMASMAPRATAAGTSQAARESAAAFARREAGAATSEFAQQAGQTAQRAASHSPPPLPQGFQQPQGKPSILQTLGNWIGSMGAPSGPAQSTPPSGQGSGAQPSTTPIPGPGGQSPPPTYPPIATGGSGQPPVTPPPVATGGQGGQNPWQSILQSIQGSQGGAPPTSPQQNNLTPITTFARDKMVDLGIYSLANSFSHRQPQETGPTRRDLTREIGGESGVMMKRDIKEVAGRGIKSFKTIANPFSGPVKKAGAMFEQIKLAKDFPFIVRDWGESLKESRSHLRNFNAQISSTFLESQRREIMRNVQSGSATSYSTNNMVKAMDDLKDTIRPYQDKAIVVMNRIAEVAARAADAMIKIVEAVPQVKIIAAILERYFKFNANTSPTASWLKDFADGVNADAKKEFNRGRNLP